MKSNVPLRFSTNFTYSLDNSGDVLTATEAARGQRVERHDDEHGEGDRQQHLLAAQHGQAPLADQQDEEERGEEDAVEAGQRGAGRGGGAQHQVPAARLVEVVSFWPGRDQYIDHSDNAKAGRPFTPFRKADLQDTPHVLYIAHDTLLALSGKTTLILSVELSAPGKPELQIVWEYWDGKRWRQLGRCNPPVAAISAWLPASHGGEYAVDIPPPRSRPSHPDCRSADPFDPPFDAPFRPPDPPIDTADRAFGAAPDGKPATPALAPPAATLLAARTLSAPSRAPRRESLPDPAVGC